MKSSSPTDGIGTTSGKLPPAIPAYIFRGHTTALHALTFFSENRYLASGDADGWIVVWSLATRRATAVWKAHEGSILGIRPWGTATLITHGRDHSLKTWQLRDSDLKDLDKTLPDQRPSGYDGKEPWLLHSMPVNALNFCPFALYDLSDLDSGYLHSEPFNVPEVGLPAGASRTILVGCPNALDSGGIDLFHLPSERRVSQIKSDPSVKTGMVMALAFSSNRDSAQPMVISGYEDGHIIVHKRLRPTTGQEWVWRRTYLNRTHSQPVLGLDVLTAADCFLSSSADALVIKHPLNTPEAQSRPNAALKSINTKHAGQQGLVVRNDGKLFATAGWDTRVRVYSAKSMNELAVLKWHREGCYCVSFARTDPEPSQSDGSDELSLLPQGTGSALAQIKRDRAVKAQYTHWLAAGGKDGKISLWDVY